LLRGPAGEPAPFDRVTLEHKTPPVALGIAIEADDVERPRLPFSVVFLDAFDFRGRKHGQDSDLRGVPPIRPRLEPKHYLMVAEIKMSERTDEVFARNGKQITLDLGERHGTSIPLGHGPPGFWDLG